MATATETLWTNSSVFTFSGTWTTNTNSAWAGGTANFSQYSGDATHALGDSVTITWTGRHLYLLAALGANGCNFQITTDGVTHRQTKTMFAAIPQSSYRVPILIERNLADGPHTTVLRSIFLTGTTMNNLFINGIISITGGPSPAPGGTVLNLSGIGDSWTAGTGVPAPSEAFFSLVTRRLSELLSRDVNAVSHGESGAALGAKSAQDRHNGVEQLMLASADNPDVITFQLGINDIATANTANGQNIIMGPGTFASVLRTTLIFAEDMYDLRGTVSSTNPVIMSVGTPGYISPVYRWTTRQNASINFSGFIDGQDAYELCVSAARQVFAQFSWANTIADVYKAMDRRNGFIYPNANADFGLHPNGEGHGVVAETHASNILKKMGVTTI